jgi:hypothetical protein
MVVLFGVAAREMICLEFLQKRAARVILGTDTSSRSIANFNKLNWIPFYDEVKINKCTLVYKSLHA